MKDIFIMWITMQLIVIGVALVEAGNEIRSGEFDCSKGLEYQQEYMGALFPLKYFADRDFITDYCADKN